MDSSVPEIRTVKPGRFSLLRRFRAFFGENGALLAAFFIPFCLFFASLWSAGVEPFGDQQILNYDAWHQYYPFFMRLHDHLRGGGTSFLYDPALGMGTNFLSLLSYYVSSPLNLLSALFAARDLRFLFTFLTAFRIGLAGFFCGLFLKKVFGRKDYTLAFFASCYALCGYLAGYYWNVMWLDAAALLPLVTWGLVALFREGKWRLYTFSLALTLFCSYYIGFMCCVFQVLAFLALWLIDHPRRKNLGRKFLRFALFSLLAGLLSAVMLLPAYFGLQNTASVSAAGPSGFRFYENFLDLFAGLSDLHEPTAIDGLPNVYAGALTAFFAFSLLWTKAVDWRRKAAGFLTLLIFALSLNNNWLDYLWHGLHFTNQIPFRFSFLFAFVLVVMAYLYFTRQPRQPDWLDMAAMLAFMGLLVYSAYRIYPDSTVIATAVALSAGMILTVLHGMKMLPGKIFRPAVCAILALEMGASAGLGVKTVGTTDYAGYFGGEEGRDILNAVQMIAEREQGAFYRMETTEARCLNEDAMYGYPGVTQFSSSANVRTAAFAQKIGLAADPGSNRYAYVLGTPLNNTLLGVKYVLSRTGLLTDTDLAEVDNDVKNNFALYQNQGFIGLGMMAPVSAANFSFPEKAKPYEIQNALFSALTGVREEYLDVIDMTNVGHKNLNVDRYGLGEYRFQVLSEAEDVTYLKYNYTMPHEGMVYVYADIPEANFLQVNNAWHGIAEYPSFLSAGYFRENEVFTLRCNIDETLYSEGSVRLYVCVLNSEVWQKGWQALADEPFEVTKWGGRSYEGTVTAKENGYLYLSVPMENSGWRVFVDGKEEKILPFADTFVGVKVNKGTHTVKLVFTPEGFVPGAILSGAALAVCVCLFVLTRKKEGRFLWTESERPVKKEEKPEETDRPAEKPQTEKPQTEKPETEKKPEAEA